MKFDGNKAWQQASAAVSANREVVLALSGVFFLLPVLCLFLLLPPPQIDPNAGSEAVEAIMREYQASVLPFLLPVLLFQALGILAVLTLLTDPARPTVGRAIALGMRCLLAYVLCQVLVNLPVNVATLLFASAGAAAGVGALATAGALALAIYVTIRTSLAGPVIVVEGERNPIAALVRSWRLTAGNIGKIGVFYLLVAVAFLFVGLVMILVAGIVLSLAGSGQFATAVLAVIVSGLFACAVLFFTAIAAAVHRQLASAAGT